MQTTRIVHFTSHYELLPLWKTKTKNEKVSEQRIVQNKTQDDEPEIKK